MVPLIYLTFVKIELLIVIKTYWSMPNL